MPCSAGCEVVVAPTSPSNHGATSRMTSAQFELLACVPWKWSTAAIEM
jgi:hypothetical protein